METHVHPAMNHGDVVVISWSFHGDLVEGDRMVMIFNGISTEPAGGYYKMARACPAGGREEMKKMSLRGCRIGKNPTNSS